MRNIIATGGTGALGQAVVAAFLQNGDRVVVPWIVKAERDELAAARASELEGGRLVLVEADVAKPEGAADVVRACGELDVLVNGVGGFAGGAPLHETDLEIWDHMYRINLRSAVCMSRAAIPALLSRGNGSILLVASRAGFDSPAGLGAYSASKAAVASLTETLHKELAQRGIRVNAVVPTTIDTPANRAAMPKADFSTWTPPARIAEVLLWLASDAAAAVSGGLIPV